MTRVKTNCWVTLGGGSLCSATQPQHLFLPPTRYLHLTSEGKREVLGPRWREEEKAHGSQRPKWLDNLVWLHCSYDYLLHFSVLSCILLCLEIVLQLQYVILYIHLLFSVNNGIWQIQLNSIPSPSSPLSPSPLPPPIPPTFSSSSSYSTFSSSIFSSSSSYSTFSSSSSYSTFSSSSSYSTFSPSSSYSPSPPPPIPPSPLPPPIPPSPPPPSPLVLSYLPVSLS